MHKTVDIVKTKADPVSAKYKFKSLVTTVRAGTSIMTTIVMRYTDTAMCLPVKRKKNKNLESTINFGSL